MDRVCYREGMKREHPGRALLWLPIRLAVGLLRGILLLHSLYLLLFFLLFAVAGVGLGIHALLMGQARLFDLVMLVIGLGILGLYGWVLRRRIGGRKRTRTMPCPFCGARNPEAAEVCGSCGRTVDWAKGRLT